MGSMTTVLAEADRFFNKILTLFKQTAGSGGLTLFCDNNEGTFSFKQEAMVNISQIATTTNELTAAKASIESSPGASVPMLFDSMALHVHHYDVTTLTWSVTTDDYNTYIRPGRVYFCPWNARIWVADKYGELHRFMTTGLTLIG